MARNTDDRSISRRGFMQATGGLTAAGLLGALPGSAATARGFDREFVNYRVVEASKAWARGYRGRPDRALGETDSGLDARHPDLGPWNGIGVDIDDGEFSLYRYEFGDCQETETGKSETFSGTIGPGATNDLVGPTQGLPTETSATHEFDAPSDVDVIDATMTWTPPSPGTPLGEFGMDVELYLDEEQEDGSWERVARSTQPGQPEHVRAPVTPGTTYRFVVETWANLFSMYQIAGTYYRVEGEPSEIVREGVTPDEVFAEVDPETVTADTPKTVGWYTTGSDGGSSARSTRTVTEPTSRRSPGDRAGRARSTSRRSGPRNPWPSSPRATPSPTRSTRRRTRACSSRRSAPVSNSSSRGPTGGSSTAPRSRRGTTRLTTTGPRSAPTPSRRRLPSTGRGPRPTPRPSAR